MAKKSLADSADRTDLFSILIEGIRKKLVIIREIRGKKTLNLKQKHHVT
ncbi:hypothetical protein GCM10022422_41550 [Flavobacterium ginsengisoli]|uniref:Transcriptional regulator n=1 Tax=Flavobacterium ginsengisoli TaxID=871694 RepID=A0ABP7FYY5_9FLAO